MVASNTAFSAMSFIGFVLVTLPLPWHLHSWNVGTVMYMLWTGVTCLKFFIDSVIWDGNAIDWAPVWCDISSRIHIGAQIGVLASSLCINRRLFHIAQQQQVIVSPAEKRRQICVDLMIALGLGLIAIPLQYIVQGHRYNIFEDIGCFPVTIVTPQAIVLVYIPPLILSLISLFYSVSTIWLFNKRRAEFGKWLKESSVQSSRYYRLMALAGVEALGGVPLSIYVLWTNFQVGVEPYTSWESIHRGFSRVDQFPAILWRNDPMGARQLELSRWLFPVCAFLFFGFFGFADEALKNYRRWALFICSKVGYTPNFASTTGWGSSNGKVSGSIPRFESEKRVERSKKVKGDGLDFDESEFDEKTASSGRTRVNTTNITVTTETTTMSDTSSIDEKDNKGGALSQPASPVAVALPSSRPAYEDVSLPDVNGLLAEPSPAHLSKKVSDSSLV